MEEKIILEGIHAMLEEIRDNTKKNPEQEMINSKLVAIEQVCNELAEKKLVTEDLMAGFISYLLKQMIEMDKKQDEKMEKLKEYILEHSKFVNEMVNKSLIPHMEYVEKRSQYSILEKLRKSFDSLFNR